MDFIIIRLNFIIVLLAIIICSGCAFNVQLDPNIDPTANIANSIDLKVGLFIPEDTKKSEISDNINLSKYNFYIGQALESIITKSHRRVFTHVEVLESYPTQQMINERKLDLAVIAKMTSGKVSLNLKQGFLQKRSGGKHDLICSMCFL